MKLRHSPNKINSLVKKYRGLTHDGAVTILKLHKETLYSVPNIILMYQEGKSTKDILKMAEIEYNEATGAIYFSDERINLGYNGVEY